MKDDNIHLVIHCNTLLLEQFYKNNEARNGWKNKNNGKTEILLIFSTKHKNSQNFREIACLVFANLYSIKPQIFVIL